MSGADHLDFSTAGFTLTSIEEIDAGAGDDTVTGTSAADTIRGNAGDDTLNGGGGDDTFLTTGSGDGLDTIDGGTGTNTWLGSGGNDYFRVTDNIGNLTNIQAIDGGAGYDKILGTGGDDHLDFSNPGFTLTGIEEIDAGAGNDTVTTSNLTGGINYRGGSGDDTFVFQASAKSATILDFNDSGNDKIDLHALGFADLAAVQTASSQVGADVHIDIGGGHEIVLAATALGSLDFSTNSDFVI